MAFWVVCLSAQRPSDANVSPGTPRHDAMNINRPTTPKQTSVSDVSDGCFQFSPHGKDDNVDNNPQLQGYQYRTDIRHKAQLVSDGRFRLILVGFVHLIQNVAPHASASRVDIIVYPKYVAHRLGIN